MTFGEYANGLSILVNVLSKSYAAMDEYCGGLSKSRGPSKRTPAQRRRGVFNRLEQTDVEVLCYTDPSQMVNGVSFGSLPLVMQLKMSATPTNV